MVCANPGLREFEIRLCESEFMDLGRFSTKYYAVYVAQNWKSMSV